MYLTRQSERNKLVVVVVVVVATSVADESTIFVISGNMRTEH